MKTIFVVLQIMLFVFSLGNAGTSRNYTFDVPRLNDEFDNVYLHLNYGKFSRLILSPTGKLYLDGGGNTYMQEQATDEIAFVCGGSESLRIFSNALAIPTTEKLYFDGGASANSAISTAPGGSGSTILYLGNKTIDTTAVSDKKTKTNIKKSSVGLKELLQLDVKEYTYKYEYNEDTTTVHVGLLAQEVQKICPAAIIERSDGIIAYDAKKLIPFLINAIHELNARIKKLENN